MKAICQLVEETTVNQHLERAVSQLDLPPETGCLLATPHLEISVELPLRRDNGSLDIYHGYRVQHHHARGPFKGGLRFHPKLDLAHARELASAMTWKTALTELPFGGGKGGITCDPSELSDHEKEQLTKRFVDRLGPLIGPDVDIPAPDIGTGPKEMAWIYQAYANHRGNHWGVVTGKPLELQGCRGRVEATGKGVALVTHWAAEHEGIDLKEATIAIQGAGNVGGFAGQFLHEAGARIVAISDSSTTLFNGDGLDLPKILEERQREDRPSLKEIDCDAKKLDSAQLLETECTILIPAAIGGVINEDNVDAIAAKLIVEGANLPTTFPADQRLREREITVIPDILANAGGVIVSYLEWSQNQQRQQFEATHFKESLERILKNAWQAVRDRVESKSLSFREAAYQIAVERVSKATQLRGF